MGNTPSKKPPEPPEPPEPQKPQEPELQKLEKLPESETKFLFKRNEIIKKMKQARPQQAQADAPAPEEPAAPAPAPAPTADDSVIINNKENAIQVHNRLLQNAQNSNLTINTNQDINYY